MARILLAAACPGSPALWAGSFTYDVSLKRKTGVPEGVGVYERGERGIPSEEPQVMRRRASLWRCNLNERR